MTHNKLVALCLELLAMYGFYAWQNNTGAVKVDNRYVRFGHPGSSDILSLFPRNGELFAVEVKVGDDPQRKEQKLFQRMVEKNNGKYLLVRDNPQILEAYLGSKGYSRILP